MNPRARYMTLASAGIAAAVALYYAIPFALIVISLGEICPYSPAGIPMCQGHTPTRPGAPRALVRASPALRALGKLAFVGYSGKGSASDIFVVNADGTGLRNITTGERQGFWEPAWSPDGTKIALIGDDEYAHAQFLNVLDVPSGTVKEVDDSGLDEDAAWSPNGQKLAFSSAYYTDPTGVSDEHSQIYLLLAGAAVAKLTDDGRGNYEPSWSPDGAMIAFTSGSEPNREIYAMGADGFGQRNLSRNRPCPVKWCMAAGSSSFDGYAAITSTTSGVVGSTSRRVAVMTSRER